MVALLWAGGGATAILAVYNLVKVFYVSWKRIDRFLNDWNGMPAHAGHDPILSMPERMTRVESRLTALEDEIKGERS